MFHTDQISNGKVVNDTTHRVRWTGELRSHRRSASWELQVRDTSNDPCGPMARQLKTGESEYSDSRFKLSLKFAGQVGR